MAIDDNARINQICKLIRATLLNTPMYHYPMEAIILEFHPFPWRPATIEGWEAVLEGVASYKMSIVNSYHQFKFKD